MRPPHLPALPSARPNALALLLALLAAAAAQASDKSPGQRVLDALAPDTALYIHTGVLKACVDQLAAPLKPQNVDAAYSIEMALFDSAVDAVIKPACLDAVLPPYARPALPPQRPTADTRLALQQALAEVGRATEAAGPPEARSEAQSEALKAAKARYSQAAAEHLKSRDAEALAQVLPAARALATRMLLALKAKAPASAAPPPGRAIVCSRVGREISCEAR